MVPNLALDLIVDRVDLVDEGANSEAFIMMYKRKETGATMDLEQILAQMKPEHAAVIRADITKAKDAGIAEGKATAETELTSEVTKAKADAKAAADALEDFKKSKATNEEPDFEEVIKSLDPGLQQYMRTMKAKQDAAEASAREMADKAATEEAVNKAKELKSIPVEQDQLVAVIKSASPEVIEILKAANAAIEDSGLLEEIGKSKANGADKTGDAWAKIEKRAKEVATETNVTFQKAVNDVIKANPDLYRAYLKEGEE